MKQQINTKVLENYFQAIEWIMERLEDCAVYDLENEKKHYENKLKELGKEIKEEFAISWKDLYFNPEKYGLFKD